MADKTAFIRSIALSDYDIELVITALKKFEDMSVDIAGQLDWPAADIEETTKTLEALIKQFEEQ